MPLDTSYGQRRLVVSAADALAIPIAQATSQLRRVKDGSCITSDLTKD